MVRDFTYIDDVVEAVLRVLDQPAQSDSKFNPNQPNPNSSLAPYRIFNVGNCKPTSIMDFIEVLEKSLGKAAIKKYLPTPLGDVLTTAANTDALKDWINFMPQTNIQTGVQGFVDWYRVWHER
jgi:UDP-glucuronate 4-epimerase